MTWYDTVFELIDMRSFSNLWFWIALAVLWSSTIHWVLGVPWDLIQRAGRQGGQAEEDMQVLVRVNVNRILYIAEVSGLWILALSCALLTGLGLLGFLYEVEFAQALFLLGSPMSIVGALSIHTSKMIRDRGLAGEPLRDRLKRHRIVVQLIGVVSIFVTAMWGMYQNMTFGALGG